MTEEYITEIYNCKCGKGVITLEKTRVGRIRSSHKSESYASIAPCPICNGTIDINGRDLMDFLKKN